MFLRIGAVAGALVRRREARGPFQRDIHRPRVGGIECRVARLGEQAADVAAGGTRHHASEAQRQRDVARIEDVRPLDENHVGGGEVADPEECKRIADLGVTMLAAGIGNIHGKYPANWQGLRFDILEKIQELTGQMPLVLHGGTGIPADMIQKAISLGVSKINVNTECQLAFAAATREYIEAGKDLEGKGFDPRKLLAPGFEAIKATVKEKMELFGSVNKA